MSILNGEGAKTEYTGISFAGEGQNLDNGFKVVHNNKNTSSVVNAKSISKNGGKCTYRSLVRINENAKVIQDAIGSTTPENTPKPKAFFVDIPLLLKGNETAAPSGKFCTAIPKLNIKAGKIKLSKFPYKQLASATPNSYAFWYVMQGYC